MGLNGGLATRVCQCCVVRYRGLKELTRDRYGQIARQTHRIRFSLGRMSHGRVARFRERGIGLRARTRV
jgi:hypothetical protein